jgi:hypothetical protein
MHSGGSAIQVPIDSGGTLVPEAPAHSVVCKLGDVVYFVGGGGIINVESLARLSVGFNDGLYSDNQGAFFLQLFCDEGCVCETSMVSEAIDFGENLHVTSNPNPTDGTVAISATLRSSTVAEVEIVDVAGRLVRSLYSGQLKAGRRDMLWDRVDMQGNRVGSGVYFVHVRAGEEVGSAKIHVIN